MEKYMSLKTANLILLYTLTLICNTAYSENAEDPVNLPPKQFVGLMMENSCLMTFDKGNVAAGFSFLYGIDPSKYLDFCECQRSMISSSISESLAIKFKTGALEIIKSKLPPSPQYLAAAKEVLSIDKQNVKTCVNKVKGQ